MQRTATTTAEAIKQQKPFKTVRQEATVAMLITTETVRRRIVDFLASTGKDQVTMQQYNVLRILRGSEGEGLPTLAIAERMMEKTPGITGMIDRLQAKGLVEREHSTHDRRQIVCHITKAGLALLKKLDEPISSLDEATLSCLNDKEARQLIELLDRIRNHNN